MKKKSTKTAALSCDLWQPIPCIDLLIKKIKTLESMIWVDVYGFFQVLWRHLSEMMTMGKILPFHEVANDLFSLFDTMAATCINYQSYLFQR